MTCRDVIVLADGDEAGEAAARRAAPRAGNAKAAGCVSLSPPKGMDFNDMLMGRAPNAQGEFDD